MKIVKVNDMDEIKYIVRHWGKWYVMLLGGGLIAIDKWFKNARKTNG
jgi:hypothetical protein